MDGRFLIYEGFETDVPEIFNNVILKYNFKIQYVSDCGVKLENSKVVLDISYETGLILWITDKLMNVQTMVNDIVSDKGIKIKEEFYAICNSIFTIDRKGTMINLSVFLLTHLTDELSD